MEVGRLVVLSGERVHLLQVVTASLTQVTRVVEFAVVNQRLLLTIIVLSLKTTPDSRIYADIPFCKSLHNTKESYHTVNFSKYTMSYRVLLSLLLSFIRYHYSV